MEKLEAADREVQAGLLGERGAEPGGSRLIASVQDIKRRVRSVRNTSKITKAMELVAAAKLRRAEARIEALRPYAERMRELMIGTARATPSRGFPLLEERENASSVAIVPLTGDRGLAGRVQRPDHPACARPGARGQGSRPGRPVGGDRQEGPLYPSVPPLRGRTGLGRLHGPARVLRRRSDRAEARRALHGAGCRPGRHRLQPVRVRADAAGRRRGRAADPAARCSRRTRRRARTRSRWRATSSTSPSRTSSSSACFRPTSRRRSTARCSSRQRRSMALA